MSEWRECVFAGKTCAETFRDEPEAFVKGTTPCEGRHCDVFSDRSMYCVIPEDCATCPVPALVDAVRALLPALDYVRDLSMTTDTKTATTYEDLIRIAMERGDAALAALPEEGNRE